MENNPFAWIEILLMVSSRLFSRQYPEVFYTRAGIDGMGDMSRLAS